MAAAADLAAALDARGCTTAAPTATTEPAEPSAPTASATPTAPAAPAEHALHGVADSRWIAPQQLVAAAEAALAAGFFYESMTCVDRLDPHGVFELLYTFNRWDEPARVALRVWAPRDAPVPSLTGVYGIAEWNEREAWELYGLRFVGHPNLTWLLLPEDTAFRPLLKSFTAPPPSSYDDSLNPSTPDADDAASHAHG